MVTNFNLMPDGQISITVETIEERLAILNSAPTFEEPSAERGISESDLDAVKEAYFRRGWEACSQETKLRYVNGTIEEFFQETGVDGADSMPEDKTPEELPLQTGVARPATDSGEPDKEAEGGHDAIDGVWTISDEELQALKQAEYDRGYERGDAEGRSAATYGRKIKRAALQTIAHAVAEDHTKRSIVDIVEATVRQLGYEVEL